MLIPPIWQERIGAGAVMGVGAVLVAEGIRLPTGHLASFGPGLFPLIMGSIIILFGALLLIVGRVAPADVAEEPIAWRPMIFVSVGMIAFAELVRTAGLIPATLAVVVISSFGLPRFRPVTALLLAMALSIAGVAIFIYGLGLALSAWRL